MFPYLREVGVELKVSNKHRLTLSHTSISLIHPTQQPCNSNQPRGDFLWLIWNRNQLSRPPNLFGPSHWKWIGHKLKGVHSYAIIHSHAWSKVQPLMRHDNRVLEESGHLSRASFSMDSKCIYSKCCSGIPCYLAFTL